MVAGQNAAYGKNGRAQCYCVAALSLPTPLTMLTCLGAPADQFPCQFQLFYRGKARRSMWYDPVFRVRPSALVSAACCALA